VERKSLKRFKKLEELFYNNLKERLLKDNFLMAKLPELEEAIQNTRKAYIETGSFAFCAKCAKEGEKCCGLGIEWKVTPSEFIINLLLYEKHNKTVAYNLERKDECLFLGENGCTLFMPPILCRNFFCEKLREFLGENKLKFIQNAMEKEANLSFILCDYLNKHYLQNLYKEEE